MHHENLFINQNVIIMKKVLSFVAALFAVVALNAQITEGFESYEAFSVDPAGSWTFYDGDEGTTYGFQSVTVPNLPYTGAGFIMNPTMTDPDITDSQGAHTGDQYLAMFNSVPSTILNGTTTNDWIISPALTNATSISFWARELTAQYGSETMRVLYSTTTNDVNAFQLIQQESVSAEEWTEYTYNLPAGTKYVAINCASSDIFALYIDDITINAEAGNGIVENNNTVSIFPNPATTVLNVNAEGYNTLEIVNLLGQTVYTANATSNMQINVSNLNNGVYFVRMNGENGTATQKFIKK